MPIYNGQQVIEVARKMLLRLILLINCLFKIYNGHLVIEVIKKYELDDYHSFFLIKNHMSNTEVIDS